MGTRTGSTVVQRRSGSYHQPHDRPITADDNTATTIGSIDPNGVARGIVMNDIRSLLKIATRRLEMGSLLHWLHLAAVVAAVVAIVLMIVDRLPGSPLVPWLWVGPGLGVLTAVIAFVLWQRHRRDEAAVALTVDERLDLREKLSTALHCEQRDDVFARAAVEDAVRVAKDPRSRELLKRRVPIAAPKGWWASPLLVLLALGISQLGQADLFAKDQPDQPAIQQAKAEMEQSIEAISKAMEQSPELASELADLMPELSKDGNDPNALKTPEDIRRNAIKKVSELNKRLEDIINGEKGKTAESLEKALEQLKTPQDGVAKELAEALAKGDFAKAQEALKDLMEKAQAGNLDDAQKQQLAEQLQNIAEQLNQLAQQQKQLEQALQQAGLNPQLAQNPQALQQAIQQAQNLNQQQKQQLQQMAQAQQQAAKMCQGLGQACQNMAQGLQNGDMAQMGQGGQKACQMMGDMEMLQQMLMQAQAMANQCQGQCNKMGQGMGQSQAMMPGGGMGQRGIGAGGVAPTAQTPFGTKLEKSPTKQTNEGDVIARQYIQGEQIVGESKAKLRAVVAENMQGIDEALAEEQVPVKYHDTQKHYFGELDKLTRDNAKPAEAKPAEPK